LSDGAHCNFLYFPGRLLWQSSPGMSETMA
jgi:hypothetical protein